MKNTFVPIDLRDDGVLWAINKAVFHPRGFALAVDTNVDVDTQRLFLMGDGTEPWSYENGIDNEKFDAFNALLARASAESPPHHHVTVYRQDPDGQWGARCLTCDFDEGGYLLWETADGVAADHHGTAHLADPS